MKGFQLWMKRHPRKRTDGYFAFGGKELTHEQVKKIVDYAVMKGYRTDADIHANEVVELLGNKMTMLQAKTEGQRNRIREILDETSIWFPIDTDEGLHIDDYITYDEMALIVDYLRKEKNAN